MFKRWLFRIIACAVLVLLLATTVSFFLAHRARAEAGRYLRVITALQIGTPYDVAVAQLRDAMISMTLPADCHRECMLIFHFSDKWVYMLHLAPPAELVGRIDFRDEKLVYKSTAMGRDMCCSADVLESASTISRTSSNNVDSTGHPWKITVELSALDFTEYRKQAYAFNLSCIGSIRGCRTDEYLPTVKS